MSRILCFGELLLRLSPQLNREWIKQSMMPVYVGGAEINVATALANWHLPVSYLTALPDNYLAKEICEALEAKNIDTKPVIFSGDRIGTYYLPQGADLKNTGVIYDRAFSSFSQMAPGQVDWDEVLKDITWFHFSAISPALNGPIAVLCREALQAAAKKGLTVSVDLNFRAKLWQWGKLPVEVMPELVQECNLVMGNIWAAEKMLGTSLSLKENTKEEMLEQAKKTSLEIMRQNPKCRQVANTFRFDEKDGLRYYATLFRDNQLYVSPEYSTTEVVDKVGSGDCFMAGLIWGNKRELPSQEMIDFAAAAAFDKLFIKGDATTSTVEAIRKKSTRYA